MLALSNDGIRERLKEYIEQQTWSVLEKAERLEIGGPDNYKGTNVA